MEKKKINEEQFKNLVLNEAKKIISESEVSTDSDKTETSNSKNRKMTFDKVESLIKEMEGMNKSIISIINSDSEESINEVVEESDKNGPNRDLDVIEHNNKKNVNHTNEGEKDKWSRMLNYKVPSDEQR